MSAMTRHEWLLSDRPTSRRQARLGQAYRTWLSFRTNWLAMVGLGIVVALVLVALFANVIAPYDPVLGGDLRTERFLPPLTGNHLLGTDDLSRDIFSRIVHGSRLTLLVVVLVAVIATPIGLLVGTTAGYFGGWIDTVLMRLTEGLLAFPRLLLVLVASTMWQLDLAALVILLGTTTWMETARLARAQLPRESHASYIEAAVVSGLPTSRVLFRHLLPNALSPLLADAALRIGDVILLICGPSRSAASNKVSSGASGVSA